MDMIRDVAIIGGGFSGTLLAINLLRHDGPRAVLIERTSAAGMGTAYGTAHPDLVLNVRAANMSAFPDRPDHFVRWLADRGVGDAATAFVPRRIYGEYLRELLDGSCAMAPERLSIVPDGAIDVAAGDGVRVALAGGATIAADAAVLAVGNLPPAIPAGLDGIAGSSRYHANPWSPAVAEGLGPDDTVLLVGTGLTMVDVVLMLRARGFAGRIVALSRRGLLPHRHAASPANDRPIDERPRYTLSMLVKEVRRRGEAIGWRNAVDELRPFTQPMWEQAPAAERGRFIRHLRPWWDVHRHRLAPVVADRVEAMIADGRLRLMAGRISDAHETAGGIDVAWRPRGAEVREQLAVQRIVCCTGPQGDLARTDDALLRALVARGTIRPDSEHLGMDVDRQGRVLAADGKASEQLLAIGPMTRGAFWEIVAVPDIRRQAWDVARRLSNADWVGGEGL